MTSNNLNEDNDSDTIFDNTNPTQFISDLNNNIKNIFKDLSDNIDTTDNIIPNINNIINTARQFIDTHSDILNLNYISTNLSSN